MGNDNLDDLFAGLRASGPVPSGDLMARVLADAAALQPKAVPLAVAPARRGGVLRALSALFGGGPVLAGMGTAAAAGLFIGFAQPSPVSALTAVWAEDAVTTTAALDVSSGIDALISEE